MLVARSEKGAFNTILFIITGWVCRVCLVTIVPAKAVHGTGGTQLRHSPVVGVARGTIS